VSAPSRVTRVRALAVVAAVLALAYLVGIHWWFTAPMLSMGKELSDLRVQELEGRMEAAQRPEIERRLAQVREFEAANPGFLPEANKELATAGLVQRLEQVVQTASPSADACQITARTPADSTGTKEDFPRVVVQVRLRCGMTELAAVLHALESGSPQLFVDNLDILSRYSYLAPGNDAGGALDVSFDLYGYLNAVEVAPRA
jgi:general secretion pathway protein M